MVDGLAIDDIANMLSGAFDIDKEIALFDVKSAFAQFESLGLVIE
jgi:hypothetical protein